LGWRVECASEIGGPAVIVRSFRGVVVRGQEATFYALIRERVAAFRTSYSMIESHIARRTTPEGDRFLITTHWPDWEVLRRWASGDPTRPWGFDEVLPYLVSWEIEHFEEIGLGEDQGR
jgi:heme-degrading monooxygenase HmoA